ncbi:response regulator transcription factor [Chloroflexus aurantiacus]
MISRGWSNRQIAKELSIKEHTIETHVGNILGKLQVASRNEAIGIFSITWGHYVATHDVPRFIWAARCVIRSARFGIWFAADTRS